VKILARKLKSTSVGKGGHGKTTLVHRLKDDFTFNENDLTQGRNDMYVCKTLFQYANLLNFWVFATANTAGGDAQLF
jgi:GTPase SAR1 family protein